MNWPPIEVPILGRSGLIALIALLHIPFFVNFVMGAPVIAVIAEWLGRRSGDSRYDTLSKHLSTMVLVTVGVGVFGGVGLVVTNIGLFPRFFSTGANIFFWPLFIEIGAFMLETVFIAVYRYTWDRMKHTNLHMIYGLLGAFGAWLSGFIINGLASFMLTPGVWPQTNKLLDAAFNPSFLPSFLHRALASLSVTGFFLVVYAIWSHNRAKDENGKAYAVWALNFSGKWALIATMLQVFPGVWYLTALERGTSAAAPEGSVVPKLLNGQLTFFWFGGIILAAVSVLVIWFFSVQSPQDGVKTAGKWMLVLSVILILTTNAFMGFTRERARKPYLVYGVMYGNEMMVKIKGAVQDGGSAAGDGQALIGSLNCTACHNLGGQGGAISLDGVGTRKTADQIRQTLQSPPPGMIPFSGTDAEMETLVTFLSQQK